MGQGHPTFGAETRVVLRDVRVHGAAINVAITFPVLIVSASGAQTDDGGSSEQGHEKG